MREMFKEYSFRFPEVGGEFGFRRTLCYATLLGTILMSPNLGYGQGLYGDPSTTMGQWGKFKLEIGAGFVANPNLKIKNEPITVMTPPQPKIYNLVAVDSTESFRSEQSFLTATVGMGRSVDLFLKVGKFKTQDPFEGDSSPSGGLGFRFSPPQTGFLKIGFQIQGFYATSENDGYNTSVDFWSHTDSQGLHYHVDTDGTAKNKLRLISYDMVLGVGVQNIPYVRPYTGLLVSFQNRSEKGSFSGQGDFTTCNANQCFPANTGAITSSWNTDLPSDSLIGGVFGLTITPIDWVGINLEGNLAGGHIGNQYGFMASAFVNF
jgi:hypothetical protein